MISIGIYLTSKTSVAQNQPQSCHNSPETSNDGEDRVNSGSEDHVNTDGICFPSLRACPAHNLAHNLAHNPKSGPAWSRITSAAAARTPQDRA